MTSGGLRPRQGGGEVAGLQPLGERAHRGIAVLAVDEQPGLLTGLGGECRGQEREHRHLEHDEPGVQGHHPDAVHVAHARR